MLQNIDVIQFTKLLNTKIQTVIIIKQSQSYE